MNPFNPLQTKKQLGLLTDRASELSQSDLAKYIEESRNEPYTFGSATLKPPAMTGGFESKPYSFLTPEEPKQYSLGADTDLKKALEEGNNSSAELGSAGIKAAGQAIGTVAKEAMANRQLESEIGQKAALQAGRSSREARERGSKSMHNALAQLMASFRNATQ